jgi:hypothetical protein
MIDYLQVFEDHVSSSHFYLSSNLRVFKSHDADILSISLIRWTLNLHIVLLG